MAVPSPESVRDVKFFSFLNALANKSKRIHRLNSDIDNSEEKLRCSINAEIGYGGARLMDVRFTGRRTMNELSRCISFCDGTNTKLRVVGSSAGNIVAYSLAFIMGVRGVCCGYDVKNPRRSGLIVDRKLFRCAVGLELPISVTCACMRNCFEISDT